MSCVYAPFDRVIVRSENVEAIEIVKTSDYLAELDTPDAYNTHFEDLDVNGVMIVIRMYDYDYLQIVSCIYKAYTAEESLYNVEMDLKELGEEIFD